MKQQIDTMVDRLVGHLRKRLLIDWFRESIIWVSIWLLLVAIALLIEFFTDLPTPALATLYYILLGGAILTAWIIGYGLWTYNKYLKIKKKLYSLAREEGDKQQVDDLIVNTLQLYELYKERPSPILQKAIEDKLSRLSNVRWRYQHAWKRVLIALPLLLIPLVFLVGMWTYNPEQFKYSVARIYNYDNPPSPPAPFSIDSISPRFALRNQSFNLKIHFSGNALPKKVHINTSTVNLFAQQDESQQNIFFVQIPGQIDHFTFHVTADNWTFGPFTIPIIPPPYLEDLRVKIEYPAHTGLSPEELATGDLKVPYGSRLTWTLVARNTSKVIMQFPDTTIALTNCSECSFSHIATRNMSYKVWLLGDLNVSSDTFNYVIEVIPDQYPGIVVSEERDSVLPTEIKFVGEVWDDYGFSALYFVFWREGHPPQKIKIPIISGLLRQVFATTWNLDTLYAYSDGFDVFYQFEVYDNDRVSGPKKSTTAVRRLRIPSLTERQKQLQHIGSGIGEASAQIAESTEEQRKQFEELSREMLMLKNLNLQKQDALREMLKDQQSILENAQKLQEQIEKQMEILKESIKDSALMQKLEELQERTSEMIPPELQKQLEELQKALEELDQERIKELMDEIQKNQKKLELSMQRMQEMLKRLQVEVNMELAIQELERLKQQMEQALQEGSQELQEELQKQWEEIRDLLERTDSLNKSLSPPMPLEMPQEQIQQTDSKMKQASDAVKRQKPDAKQKQQEAQQSLEQLQQQLQQALAQMRQKQQEINLELVKRLIDRLLTISQTQESLINTLKKKGKKPELLRDQHLLRGALALIEDSLLALANNIPSLSQEIINDFIEADFNMKEAYENLKAERRPPKFALVNQRTAMEKVNELILMLEEVKDQTEAQLSMSSGACNNPRPGQGSKPSLSQMQKQLSEKLKQLAKQMQKQQGESKEGAWNKEIARLAMQQMLIRQMLERLAQETDATKQELKQELKGMAEEMKELEEKLINKQVDRELIERQEQLTVRLLQAEKALRQQEEEPTRKAERPEQQYQSIILTPSPDSQRRFNTLIPEAESIYLTPTFKQIIKRYIQLQSQQVK